MRQMAANPVSLIDRRPFRRLPRQAWWNLGFVAAAFLLGLYCAISLRSRGVFEYWGADYRAFRASAEIARQAGYAKIYDLAAQDAVQRPLYARNASAQVQKDYAVIPTPYLPVFILPMQLLLALPPVEGWVAWMAIQIVALFLYFRRIRSSIAPLQGPSTLALFVALPTFFTITFGQVNILILVGFCEFLLALRQEKDFEGGLWLGLLMVKPQLLVLILPALLLERRWRTLLSAGVVCLGVVIVSLFIAGRDGISALVALWLGYTGSMPTTYPESMMNWRGLMLNLQPLIGTRGSAWIAVLGIGAAALTGIGLWLCRQRREGLVVAGNGIYAMTCTVAWHSHVHLALPLLGTMYGLKQSDGLTSDWLNALILVPTLAFAVLGIIVDAGAAHRVAGMLFLAFSLALGASLTLRRVYGRSGEIPKRVLASRPEAEPAAWTPLPGHDHFRDSRDSSLVVPRPAGHSSPRGELPSRSGNPTEKRSVHASSHRLPFFGADLSHPPGKSILLEATRMSIRVAAVATPLLLAIVPLVTALANNIEAVAPRHAVRPMLATLCVAALVIAVCRAVIRERERGLVVASLLVLLWSAGSIGESVRASAPDFLAGQGATAISALWIALLLAAAVIAVRKPQLPKNLILILFTISLPLVLVPLGTIARHEIGLSRPYLSGVELAKPTGAPILPAPDVYYLVLDGFGREDILADTHQIDTGGFIAGLRQLRILRRR